MTTRAMLPSKMAVDKENMENRRVVTDSASPSTVKTSQVLKEGGDGGAAKSKSAFGARSLKLASSSESQPDRESRTSGPGWNADTSVPRLRRSKNELDRPRRVATARGRDRGGKSAGGGGESGKAQIRRGAPKFASRRNANANDDNDNGEGVDADGKKGARGVKPDFRALHNAESRRAAERRKAARARVTKIQPFSFDSRKSTKSTKSTKSAKSAKSGGGSSGTRSASRKARSFKGARPATAGGHSGASGADRRSGPRKARSVKGPRRVARKTRNGGGGGGGDQDVEFVSDSSALNSILSNTGIREPREDVPSGLRARRARRATSVGVGLGRGGRRKSMAAGGMGGAGQLVDKKRRASIYHGAVRVKSKALGGEDETGLSGRRASAHFGSAAGKKQRQQQQQQRQQQQQQQRQQQPRRMTIGPGEARRIKRTIEFTPPSSSSSSLRAARPSSPFTSAMSISSSSQQQPQQTQQDAAARLRVESQMLLLEAKKKAMLLTLMEMEDAQAALEHELHAQELDAEHAEAVVGDVVTRISELESQLVGGVPSSVASLMPAQPALSVSVGPVGAQIEVDAAEARLAAIRAEEERLEAEIAQIAAHAGAEVEDVGEGVEDARVGGGCETFRSVVMSGVPGMVSSPAPRTPPPLRRTDSTLSNVSSEGLEVAQELARLGSVSPEPELEALVAEPSPVDSHRVASLRNPNLVELMNRSWDLDELHQEGGRRRPSHLTALVISPNAASCPAVSPW